MFFYPFCVTGTHMMDKCLLRYSCGTNVAMWTDEPMPKDIGVPTNVRVYGSRSADYRSLCKQYTIQVEVVRCSLIDHDLVYRYISNDYYNTPYPDNCPFAFCGVM